MTRYLPWLAALVLPGGSILAIVYGWRWLQRQRSSDPKIDRYIVPPVQKFAGHDEALAQRTRARREHAEQIKAEGRRLDTRDDSRSKIHMVSR